MPARVFHAHGYSDNRSQKLEVRMQNGTSSDCRLKIEDLKTLKNTGPDAFKSEFCILNSAILLLHSEILLLTYFLTLFWWVLGIFMFSGSLATVRRVT